MSLPFEQLKPGMFDVSNKPLLSKFDFTQPGKFETFDNGSVIGMTGLNTTSYADHALARVWSEPANLIAHSTDLTQSAGGSGTVDSKAVNGGDVLRGDGTRETQRFDVITGKRYFFEFEIGKAPVNTPVNFPFRATGLTAWEGGTYLGANLDLVAGTLSETGGGNYSVITSPQHEDRWRVRFDATSDNTRSDASINFNDQSFVGAGPAGTVVLYIWQCSAAYQTVLQKTEAVAALDNFQLNNNAVVSLAAVNDEIYYELTGPEINGVHPSLGYSETLLTDIPYALGIEWFSDDPDSYGQLRVGSVRPSLLPPFVDLPSEPEFYSPGLQILTTTINSASIQLKDGKGRLLFRFPRCNEGNKLFNLKTYGAPRHLIRRTSDGRLHEPSVQNKCQNFNVAPVDLTNVNDGANVTTTRHDRYDAALPVDYWNKLDRIDSDKTIQSVYLTVGNATGGFAYATGGTGNTNIHNVSVFGYVYNGPGTGGVALETALVQNASAQNEIERISGTGTPVGGSDRLSVNATNASIIWFGNQLTEGAKLRSLISIGGSTRTKSKDAPLTPTDGVGINRGRNSIPQASNQGAAAPGTHPNTWVVNNTNNWTWTITEVGLDYIDYNLSTPAAGGSVDLFPQLNDAIAATQGETWRGSFDLEIVSGDISNLAYFGVFINERDAGQTSVAASSLNIKNLLASERRAFSFTRTVSNGLTELISLKLQINATSGAFDFTFRIYTGENTCPSIQKLSDFAPRKLTTGTAIEYKQWEDGLTVVDVWDVPSDTGDNKRFWEAYGSDRVTNRVEVLGGSGASSADGLLRVTKDGSTQATTATESVIGLHTQQSALKEGDQEYWIDGASQGTLTSGMPIDIDKWILGDQDVAANNNRDGIQKSIAFYGYRATEAIAA